MAASPRVALARGLTVGALAALLLAFVGALGTGQASFPARLAYWAAVVLPGSLLGLAAAALVRRWSGIAARRWAQVGLIALAVSLPHTFLVIVASAIFFGVGAITPMLVAEFWLAVFVVTLVLTAINHLAITGTPASPAPAPPPPTVPATASASASATPPCLPAMIADKMPPHLAAARLLAIAAEDHYLRIHTDAGDALILLRMADACALLDAQEGLRVHRSWWVARAAVADARRDGDRLTLLVPRVGDVPVSRAMRREAQALVSRRS